MDHVIWNNDAVALYDDVYAEMAEERIEGDYECSELDENEVWERVSALVDIYLEDEIANLNIDKKNNILLIGNLQRWDGSHSAYKDLKTNNIGKALEAAVSSFEGGNTLEIGVEDGKVLIKQLGHDNPVSPSVFEFRMVKDHKSVDELVCETDDDSHKTLIANSLALSEDVAKVYGWDM